MKDYKFWSIWPKAFQNFYFLLIFIFLIVTVLYLVAYTSGISNILDWATNANLQNLKHSLYTFDLGLFSINVPAYSYIIEETFVPKDFSINIPMAYGFTGLLFFCLAVANTLITTLERPYFLGGIATLIFSFLVLKFDELGLFGIFENYFVGGFLIVIGVVSYYFQAFRQDFSFFKRLIVFLLIYVAILLISAFGSTVSVPLFSLAHHGLLLASIITLVFIVMVSHEILYGFLFLVTYSAGQYSKKTLIHFMVVSVLYFFCLVTLYFKVMGFSDFQIFGTDAFLIIPFSILIGFYGFKARESTYQNFVKFGPYGAILYAILAIISLSTLGYFFFTYNDPAIEAFQDYIIFSHLGIGFIFFIYILVNFGGLLKENLPVYKIAFKPERMPFFFVKIGGLLIAGILIARSNYLQLNQSVSAYMISMGDISLAQQDTETAKRYYAVSKDYDNYNFRSNYSLSELALKEKKEENAIAYLNETFTRKPSPFSFIRLSDIYLKNDLYFDAIFALKMGTKEFPKNHNLLNNLSLLYSKTAFVDSAFIFINSGRNFSGNDPVVNANYWGFIARNNRLFNEKADSLIKVEKTPGSMAGVNNRMAFLNAINKKTTDKPVEINNTDTTFSEQQFSLLNNYLLNTLTAFDSSLYKNLDQKEKKFKEKSYSENLSLLKALYLYSNKNIKDGFAVADKLSKEGVTNVGYYNLLLGLWSLQNGADRLAVDYFNLAIEKGNREAFFYKALALSETGNTTEAIPAWENVIQLNDPSTQAMATAIKGILGEQDISSFFQLGDEFKYHALRFRFEDLDQDQKEGLIQNISDQKIRVYARLLVAEKALENNDSQTLRAALANIDNQNVTDKALLSRIKTFSNKTAGQPLNSKPAVDKAIHASPFDIIVIRNAVEYYNNQKNSEAGYNVALDATKLNPYSEDLLKLYILQSLKVNLINYANDGMEKLKEITTSENYTQFEIIFNKEKALKESSEEVWH